MKTKPRESRKLRAASPVPRANPQPVLWIPFAFAALAAVFVWWVYAPAAHGPFLFDDNTLPFALPEFNAPFSVWVRNLRPVLMASYWMNARVSGDDTYSYHLVNLLLHCIAGGLVFLIVRRLLEWSQSARENRILLAGFAAAAFLLHPVQAESVAYLAGRSESLSDMLMLAAFAAFLYRGTVAISWRATAAVAVLFAAAVLSKEQTIVLPALLLLTDFWWNPGFSGKGIARNWRIYALLAVGAVLGVIRFLPLILSATTAGFGLKDLNWYEYLFTQFRALFVYIGLFLFPFNQTADWDFPISHTIFDHGAWLGLVALLAAVAVAWHYRRSYRLASFGFFVYLVLMAPTSSILPIRDPVAERRVYAAIVGLILIVVDLLGRLKLKRNALVASCSIAVVVFAVLAHARAEVWSSARSLWEDAAQKSPNKARVHFQLASAYCGPNCGGAIQDQSQPRCDLAVQEFQKTAQLEGAAYDLLVDWAAAYDCLNQPDQAVAKLKQAAGLESTAHVYTQIARVYAERQRWTEALDALATAEKLDPNYAVTYSYRGKVHLAQNQAAAAVQDYRRALALDPNIPQAKEELARAQAQVIGR